MLLSTYSFASLCLVIALALAIALIIRLIDHKLDLLRAIPSPLKLWRVICGGMIRKLDKKERGEEALIGRGKTATLMLLVLAGLLGSILDYSIHAYGSEIWEVILLAGFLLHLPNFPDRAQKDEGMRLRDQIESSALNLLQHILAPIMGWLLLGWIGVTAAITAAALRDNSLKLSRPLAQSIERITNLIMYLPACLAIGLIAFAALFIGKSHPLSALRQGMQVLRNPHLAVIATVAEAMHMALAGGASIYRRWLGDRWQGEGTAKLQAADWMRWQWMSWVAQGLLVGILLLLSILL
jgi:cobalamin biosynthesis protein CobD/CbiB